MSQQATNKSQNQNNGHKRQSEQRDMIDSGDSDGEKPNYNDMQGDEIDEEDKSGGEESLSEDSQDDQDEEIFLSENPYQQVNKNNYLGQATYSKWMRKYKYYFGLDMQQGRLLLYKKQIQKKHSTNYTLIKGKFEEKEKYTKDDGDDIIRIRNKKGRKFKLEVFQNKDPKKIRELIELCFSLQIEKQSKGFYATLGRSVMQVINNPFNVSSGIIVDMKKGYSDQEVAKAKKSKLEKEKINKVKGFKQLSSLFFSQSELLKEILGSISGFILNPFKSKALSESFSGVGNFAIGLVFKPISGTIDLIGKSSQSKKDHVIHQNVFKVFKVLNNTKKKNKRTQQKEEIERQKRETALEIHDEFMEKVFECEGEVLYLNKKNQLGITKKDIVQLSSLAQGLNLEDVDGTLKENIQYEDQKVRMNRLLDYYIKNRKEKSEEYEEDMCEFIVLQPIIEKLEEPEKMLEEPEKILEGIELRKPSASFYSMEYEQGQGDIEEIGDEVGDERVGVCLNKQIPLTTNYHQIQKRETFSTNLPQFLVRDSPFKNLKDPSKNHYLEDILQKEEKYLEEGQLKIPFVDNNIVSGHKLGVDTDDEMQFHSFTNQSADQIGGNDVNSQDNSIVDHEPVHQKQNAPQASLFQKYNNHQQENENEQLKENGISSPYYDHSAHTQQQDNKQSNILQVELPSSKKGDSQTEIKDQSSSPSPFEDGEKEESEGEGEGEDEEEDEDKGIAKAQDKNIYFSGNKADLEKLVKTFNGVKLKDIQRVADSHEKGGKQCLDKAVINTTRSVGKFIISEIGRKIISGDFNLTQVSFPIKAMIPKSALQTALTGTCLFPIYMGIASQTNDYVERMKLLITAAFANFPVANTFLKPLNPILGETFNASYIDGTKLYGEQISHHPPISYFLAQGPNKSYQYYGYYLYEAKAGWNSLTLKNKGKRSIIFKDGQKVDYNFGYEYYSGTFMGTMKHETLGEVTFIDQVNKIEATILTGKVKKKPSDYISGDIKVNGKVVSTCFGSYLGFIEFDGKRYWDFREVLPLKMNISSQQLQSDHQKRKDRKLLAQGNLKESQKEKERLELIQRQDGQLRHKHEEKINKALKKEKKAQSKK